MNDFRRRSSDHFVAGRTHRVSEDHEANGKKDRDTRLRDLEHDIVLNTDILQEVRAQNNKYAAFLEEKMKHEEASHEFWAEIRKRLATAGIIGVFGLLGAALIYAAKAFVKNL